MKPADPSSTVFSAGPLEQDWTNDPLNYAVKGFIAFLQTIFESAPPGYFHWRPLLEESEIVITEENPVKLETVERRPVVSVILGQTRFNGTSLDDLLDVKASNAQETHTDLLPGTMSLNCMSKVPSEARFIAWICARSIWNLRKIFIREALFHDVGRNISIGPVSPAGALVQGDTEGEWHSVAVMCPFFLQWTDKITPLREDWNGRPIYPLNQISMQFRTRMGIAEPKLTHEQAAGPRLWGTDAPPVTAGEQRMLRPPTIRGRVIKAVSPSPQPGSDTVPLEQKIKV